MTLSAHGVKAMFRGRGAFSGYCGDESAHGDLFHTFQRVSKFSVSLAPFAAEPAQGDADTSAPNDRRHLVAPFIQVSIDSPLVADAFLGTSSSAATACSRSAHTRTDTYTIHGCGGAPPV